ncbi:MAG: tRNA pseudouridine(38-40) synthase TruA [Pseudomonadota bacterium]
MPRYAFKIEYDGGPFVGWQRQKEQLSVQGQIEAALAKLEPDHPGIFGAGRTDTGVHATGQVAHVDLQKKWEPDRLRQALNHHLKPDPIGLTACAEVTDAFHARFSALERRYIFKIVSRRTPLVFEKGYAWQIGHHLDLEAMRTGAAHLIGKHDFTTFRSTMCQARSPIKTVDQISIDKHPYPGSGTQYRFEIVARSFLHNQVRSFVGTLERVGCGSWKPKDVKSALDSRDRAACGPVCPAEGLYLAEISYSCAIFA